MTSPIRGNIMKSPTVFVLGAGASNPFGLPLGKELKNHIISQSSNYTTRKDLLALGFDDSLVNRFFNTLKTSSIPMIDVFLEKHPSLHKLGAHLIATAIMPLESSINLFPKKNWYGDLFEALNFEAEEPDASLLSIVTLNYDRSLEHFLYMNIKADCHEKLVKFAHKKSRKIKIVHAHGDFGKYPEVPYGVSANKDTLKKAGARIKITSDRLNNTKNYRAAQELISKANHIVFLGFSYDERILDNLLAKTDLEHKHLYGTTVNLNNATEARLKDKFGDQFTTIPGTECDSFLKQIGVTGIGR